MVLEVGLEQPEGREQARPGRHDHASDLQLAGHAGDVDRSAPAEGKQREITRVAAAVGGNPEALSRAAEYSWDARAGRILAWMDEREARRD